MARGPGSAHRSPSTTPTTGARGTRGTRQTTPSDGTGGVLRCRVTAAEEWCGLGCPGLVTVAVCGRRPSRRAPTRFGSTVRPPVTSRVAGRRRRRAGRWRLPLPAGVDGEVFLLQGLGRVSAGSVGRGRRWRGREASGSRVSESDFRSLVEHSKDLVSRHQPDGLCLYASPAALALLGVAPQDLVGRNGDDRVHPDDVAAVAESHTAVCCARWSRGRWCAGSGALTARGSGRRSPSMR